MFTPNHITARLKMLRHRQTRGFGAFRNKILFHWALMLVLIFWLFGLVSAYSAYTFLYWYNIEDRPVEAGEMVFDQAKLDNVFRDYDQKAVLTEKLLNEAATSLAEVSTSTASSTEAEVLED